MNNKNKCIPVLILEEHLIKKQQQQMYTMSVIYILNKNENATPELFAIYIQNYANQE